MFYISDTLYKTIYIKSILKHFIQNSLVFFKKNLLIKAFFKEVFFIMHFNK